MTDNEIIKALECCGRIKGQDCDTCPLTELQLSECTAKVATESLDLINRQKAEIERLNKKYSRMKFNLESVLAERADHTEAIKEFASRIEGVLSLHPAQAKYYLEIKKEYIKENENESD